MNWGGELRVRGRVGYSTQSPSFAVHLPQRLHFSVARQSASLVALHLPSFAVHLPQRLHLSEARQSALLVALHQPSLCAVHLPSSLQSMVEARQSASLVAMQLPSFSVHRPKSLHKTLARQRASAKACAASARSSGVTQVYASRYGSRSAYDLALMKLPCASVGAKHTRPVPQSSDLAHRSPCPALQPASGISSSNSARIFMRF